MIMSTWAEARQKFYLAVQKSWFLGKTERNYFRHKIWRHANFL